MVEQELANYHCNKAELFVLRKEYDNALKKRLKAIQIVETEGTTDVSVLNTLQQMENLANMLILMCIIGKEYPQARELLPLYEVLISEYENEECLDYGFCQTPLSLFPLNPKAFLNNSGSYAQ